MFDETMIAEIAKVAEQLDIELAALLAITDVESAGQPFAVVKGRREPLIRFEGHYFDRRLAPEKRILARQRKLAAPTAGVIANPKTQAARWDMLARAVAIDPKAAYESVSWGVGQVMGAHWAWLGYAGVEALAAEARSGIGGQVRLMAKFIVKAGLSKPLAAKDWAAFARGYNGPNYRIGKYDQKLAAAYKIHSGSTAVKSAAPGNRQSSQKDQTAAVSNHSTGQTLLQRLRNLYAMTFTSRREHS